MNLGYQLDPAYVVRHLGELGDGLAWTLVLTTIGLCGGIIAGLALGAVRAYRLPVFSNLVAAFVELIRNTPLFVQIFFLYFGLPKIGMRASAFEVACASLIIWGAAYNAENYRAALLAVPYQYEEAGRALGLGEMRTFWSIRLPIAIRFAMPSVTNISVETLKNSALMLAISFPELTDTAINLVAVSFRVFELFIVIGITYLVLAASLTQLMRSVEHRLAWPA